MLDDLLKPAPEQIVQVSELTQRIKRQLESGFSEIWIQGEVSNLRRQSSGHVYFSLKDNRSQVPCVLFARDAARQSIELCDGQEVLLFGDLSVYEPHGRYQLIAKIALHHGEGRLQIAYEKLKRKLAAEGLFDKARKQPMPALPLNIAIVTSPTGAALQDFLRILKRRGYGGRVSVLPARVQGQGAADEIIAMLNYAATQKNFDLIVICRGGGSIEDLWAFNEAALAYAVAECPVPVISAVGHEIDTVLTDYAADYRAETPSGAAELISSSYLDTLQLIANAEYALTAAMGDSLRNWKHRIEQTASSLKLLSPERHFQLHHLRLDDLETRLRRALLGLLHQHHLNVNEQSSRLQNLHPKELIQLSRIRLKNAAHRLALARSTCLKTKASEMGNLQKRLDNSSLNASLKRGFAIVKKSDKRQVISSAREAQGEESVHVTFHDGDVELHNKEQKA